MLPRWINTPKGIFLSDLVRVVKGGILVPAPNVNPITIAAAPSATIPTNGTPVVVEGQQDCVTEVFSLMGNFLSSSASDANARASVFITDTAFRRRYMNRHILVSHIFGSNIQPAFLRETVGLEQQQTLLFEFLNNSTAGSLVFQMALEMRKFQPVSFSRKVVSDYIFDLRQRKTYLSPYWLTSEQGVSIPAGGQVNVFFTNQRDVDLVLLGNIASFITTGVAGNVVEGFACEFFDAGTERPLQNQPVVRSCCSGTSAFPFMYPTGQIVEPNTTIRVRMTNLVTDQATTVFFTMFGVAAYTRTSPLDTPALRTIPAPVYRGIS